MRYAIVESGGKQYKAIEGKTIDVDRLPQEAGTQIDLQSVLLMADGDEVIVGTPVAGGIEVKATVVDHVRGSKVIHFRYSPKKRIRVRGGHRAEYTRLMVDFIGRHGETRKREPVEEKVTEAPVEKAPAEKKARPSAAAARKSPEKPDVKRPAAKTAPKAATKKTGK